VRQSIRCVALALLSAAAVSFGAQSASAGLLDGGWGCGCGTQAYTYVQPYAAPQAYVVEQRRTVVRRTYVVSQMSYGSAPEATVDYDAPGWGWGWRHHHHFGGYGWHHHF
jgi:hypothetical protein